MGHRNDTATRLAARARREGAPSAADLPRPSNADWVRFEQNMAALTYYEAANTPDELGVAKSYFSF